MIVDNKSHTEIKTNIYIQAPISDDTVDTLSFKRVLIVLDHIQRNPQIDHSVSVVDCLAVHC